MSKTWTWIIILLVIALAVVPLFMHKPAPVAEGEEEVEIFAGADGLAEEEISNINPDYEPIAKPLWEPPSGEIESLLFALQAAIGSGFIAYFFGLKRGEQKAKKA